MRKQRGTPSWRDTYVMLQAISPSGAAWGRFVGGHQSGLAGCKLPRLCKRQPLPVPHRGNASRNHGAPLHNRVQLPTYLATCVKNQQLALCVFARFALSYDV